MRVKAGRLVAALALVGLGWTPGTTQASVGTTCFGPGGTFSAYAQVPFQVVGSRPPRIQFNGRVGCNGSNDWSWMDAETYPVVDVGSDAVFGPANCYYPNSPCRANGTIVKLWGCHWYGTHAEGTVHPVSGIGSDAMADSDLKQFCR